MGVYTAGAAREVTPAQLSWGLVAESVQSYGRLTVGTSDDVLGSRSGDSLMGRDGQGPMSPESQSSPQDERDFSDSLFLFLDSQVLSYALLENSMQGCGHGVLCCSDGESGTPRTRTFPF